MTRRLAAMIGLLVGLAPLWAHAQTNIDEGKSPAQIFAAACAECHKSIRTLARGKSSYTLTDFLQEHYTTSRAQAAALAAYVLSARGSEAGAAAARGQGAKPQGQKPAAAEESPQAKQQSRGKPEAATPATARLHQQPPPTAMRNRRKEPAAPAAIEPGAVPHEPAAVVAEPAAPAETPGQETSPSPAAAASPPAEAGSGEAAPVQRDTIPD